jgi:BirA family biotin operon repressor/biotin-[acetyl-CoA-carboxylase] ligase
MIIVQSENRVNIKGKKIGMKFFTGDKKPMVDLIEERIKAENINSSPIAQIIKFFSTLPSTNAALKEMADDNAPHGTVLIADSQTAGYGRFKREFFSPVGGLYMSILLRPPFIPENPTKITAAAAVMVSRAISRVCGLETNIKWVNDIELGGKKIGGILTEAKFGADSKIEWIVLGIGLNILAKQFPDELSHKAAALFNDDKINPIEIRNRLAEIIIEELISSNNWFREDVFVEYKKRNTLIGQTVFVQHGNQSYDALAMAIDDELRLVVRKNDGTVITLLSEEVSVRKKSAQKKYADADCR